MIGGLGALARPVLFALEPERAHRATIAALKLLPLLPCAKSDPRLAVTAFGLDFPNPLGMAAGFDKGGEVADQLLRLGFGHVEVGTITPRPQPGNPAPRLFRLVDDKAVINRLGFNSEGHAAVHRRLARRRGGGIVGVNIGANKASADRVADYVAGIAAFADVASYFTVNISSPNTPGLRDLQQAAALDDLIARVLDARDRCAERHGRKPVLLKIAPDLGLADLDDIVRVCRARRIDGMIVSNTTVTRPPGLNDSVLARRGRRAFGTAAVCARHPDAGGDLSARRAAISARRCRRHRRTGRGFCQDRGGSEPPATLFGAGLRRARPSRRHPARSCRPSHGEGLRADHRGDGRRRRRLGGRKGRGSAR